jgi:alanine dehydrogenase
MNIAILTETKNPPDRRVPLTPLQCRQLLSKFPNLDIQIQPDKNRCFSDEEYKLQGIPVKEDLSDRQILLGVKEVKIESLLAGKTYLFFSHTAKKQKHNLELLRSVIAKKIQLIDYEYLTDSNKMRLVAFGRWAGFVGAYNALRAYGLRSGKFNLKPAWQCKDKDELLYHLSNISISDQKIVLTGGGRVANGAMEILNAAGFRNMHPEEFIESEGGNLYTQLDPCYYVRHINKTGFDLAHFFAFPNEYENSFTPFTHSADIFIACHFWDPRSPVLMTPGEMQSPEFRIKVIADISCDTPGPIPSTLRASTISEPFYGYNVHSQIESDPFEPENITIMSVDNLPGEIPRDASEDFGNKLVADVIPSLLGYADYGVIERASITWNGRLTDNFGYLQGYLEGKE